MISPCLASFLIYSLIFSFVSIYIAFLPLSFKIFVISSNVILCVFTSLDAYILVASFAAVSALFVLPTYPTLLGAVQMDDTGTTRIGKYIFNHSFFIPGVLAIAFSVALGFLIAPILL